MFQPKSEIKVWGKVLHIFSSEHAAVSCLEVKKGYQCSRHSHRERANMFCVQEGAIEIEEWNSTGSRLSTMLGPGSSYVVPSGILHRFRVIESGMMVEVYWPDVEGGKVRSDDIERLDTGGKIE